MAYLFYLDKVLLPIAPSKLQIKITNQNSTLNLINDGEVSILKKAGLSEVSFDVLLPNVNYPFASYNDGFQKAIYYLDKLEELKTSQEPFQFIITREFPSGDSLHSTNMTVSLENYTITEQATQGFDVVVSISLKQYKSYGTKTCTITFSDDSTTATTTVSEERESDVSEIGIGSSVLVNGTLHTTSYGDGAGSTKTNYTGKVNFINMSGSHPYHVTTPDGGWLGWVTASSVQGV